MYMLANLQNNVRVTSKSVVNAFLVRLFPQGVEVSQGG